MQPGLLRPASGAVRIGFGMKRHVLYYPPDPNSMEKAFG